MKDEFSPFEIIEQLKSTGIDPSFFEEIQEDQFPKAPHFLEFCVGPQFLNTRILPKQLAIGIQLFAEYCPDCSNPGYIDKLFDQSIGNIKDNIMFLEHGICPKCKTTRFELVKSKKLIYKNELVAACGQRCIPEDSLLFTDQGIKPMNKTQIGDKSTHGIITNRFDSGILKSLKITTKFNYTLTGSKDSHIVPILRQDKKWHKLTEGIRIKRKYKQSVNIEYVALKDCQVGDFLLLNRANLWPTDLYKLPKFTFEKHPNKEFNFPRHVTADLARLTGYLIADGQYTKKYNISIMSSNPYTEKDIKRCCLNIFNEYPSIDEERPTCINFSINGIQVVEWFKFIGLKPATHRDKEIPAYILQSPKNIVCDFLAGLFGADGNIYKEKNSNTIRIQYTSTSKKLIKQLRLILLNLGIICRCDKIKSPKYSKSADYSIKEIKPGEEAYFLAFKDSEHVKIFKDNVHLVEKKKIDILALNKPVGCTRYYTPYDSFMYKNYARWPQSLKDLYNKGYYPVPIEKIEDGPELKMLDISIPNTNIYTADGFVHHNSGKSKLVGLLANYVLHLFLKIPSPVRFFNQTTGDVLNGTFAGLTLERAYKNLWNPFSSFMRASPWFQRYHKFLKDEGKKLGVELLHELKDSITYTHKQIYFDTIGSEPAKARGDTRIFFSIDELGWMLSEKSDGQMYNADGLYTALSNSLLTMRTKYKQIWSSDNYDIPPIISANISSPSSAKDKIMRLYKDSKKNPRILGLNIPTWEMNCDFTYESLRQEFSHMSQKDFERDFMAQPPIAANPFLDDPKLIDKIATAEPFTAFEAKEVIEKDPMGDDYKTLKFILHKGDKVVPRMLTFDLGYKKNDLAICLFSVDEDSKPRLDFSIAIHPEPDCRINMASVFENFTKYLVENFKIKHAFFDRWNSLDQIERLKIMEVNAKIHTLTYKEFDSVRGTIYSQALTMPSLSKPMVEYVKDYKESDNQTLINSSVQLGLQLLTVRDLGHKVVKPLLGNDDIFRAFCLGVVKLSDPTIKQEYQSSVELNSKHRVAHLGTIRGRSHTSGIGTGSIGTVEGDNGLPLGSVRSLRGRS